MYNSNFNALPQNVQTTLLAAYSLPELEFYKIKHELQTQNFSKETVEKLFTPEIAENIETLKDSVNLLSAIIFVISADKMSDYDNDVKSYNKLADKLNQKYGEIVQKIDLNGAAPLKLGFIKI